MDYSSIGLILITFGVILFVIEMLQPGFFIAIPATVAFSIGTLVLIFKDAMTSALLLSISLVIAVLTFGLTIRFYKKLAPPGTSKYSPDATTKKGSVGIVLENVEPNSLKGKVKISSHIYSATSPEEIGVIEKGTKVTVIKSEGVHVVVEPLEKKQLSQEKEEMVSTS